MVGTPWTVDGTIDADTVTPVPEGLQPPTLRVGDDGAAQVFTGCNNASTDVTIEGDTMTFGSIATTKRSCIGPAGDLEQQVLAVLDVETTFVEDGTRLTIMKDDQGLEFVAAP